MAVMKAKVLRLGWRQLSITVNSVSKSDTQGESHRIWLGRAGLFVLALPIHPRFDGCHVWQPRTLLEFLVALG